MLDPLTARRLVVSGDLRGAALQAELSAVPVLAREGWVDALLALPEPPPDSALPRGCVPYLPAAIDDILVALSEAPVTAADEFVDIGSGLGRVVLLAHLLTRAKAHGIEIQRDLVRCARTATAELGLSRVTFERGDASEAQLEGSVFFLYSPLTGEALRRVLFALRHRAGERRIVVCAVGLRLDQEAWLERRASSSAAVTFYESGPLLR